jgi:hypothetical protein
MTTPKAPNERWMELAELATTEQDPQRLIVLVSELNQVLDEKLKRLNDLRSTPKR